MDLKKIQTKENKMYGPNPVTGAEPAYESDYATEAFNAFEEQFISTDLIEKAECGNNQAIKEVKKLMKKGYKVPPDLFELPPPVSDKLFELPKDWEKNA